MSTIAPISHLGLALSSLRNAISQVEEIGDATKWPTPLCNAIHSIRDAMEHVELIIDEDRARYWGTEVCAWVTYRRGRRDSGCALPADTLTDDGTPYCADHYIEALQAEAERREELREIAAEGDR